MAERPFDLPWVVVDCKLAARRWNWSRQTKLHDVLEEIAKHAEQHPDWLDLTAG